MKRLFDLCLTCIGDHLDTITRPGAFLAPQHKELLLEFLCNHDKLTPNYLLSVTYNLFSPALKRINLFKSLQVTDDLLLLLNSSKCQLLSLTLHGCPKVTDKGILGVTEGQAGLQCLELRKLPKLTGVGLRNIFCPDLQTLDLRGCTNITSDGLCSLIARCPSISRLILTGLQQINASIFPCIAEHLADTLVELDLNSCHSIQDEDLLILSKHCRNINRLCMYGCNKLTSLGLSVFAQRCSTLTSIDLSFCSKLESPPDGLLELPTSLKELSLGGIQLKDEELFVQILTRLPLLTEMNIYGVPAVSDDSVLKVNFDCYIGPQLQLIHISGSGPLPLSDAGLAPIAEHCVALRSLSLSLLRSITGKALLPLFRNEVKARFLTSLVVRCTMFEAEVLHSVALNCSGLTKLVLSGMGHVDDDIVLSFAEHCRQLTYVGLKGCHQVSDEAVIAMARNLPLTIVVLSGLHLLTDRSVYALANSCPQLEEVYLSGCSRVHRAAVLRLTEQCLPRVYYEHYVPNHEGMED